MKIVEYHSCEWALLVETGWITAWVDVNNWLYGEERLMQVYLVFTHPHGYTFNVRGYGPTRAEAYDRALKFCRERYGDLEPWFVLLEEAMSWHSQ